MRSIEPNAQPSGGCGKPPWRALFHGSSEFPLGFSHAPVCEFPLVVPFGNEWFLMVQRMASGNGSKKSSEFNFVEGAFGQKRRCCPEAVWKAPPRRLEGARSFHCRQLQRVAETGTGTVHPSARVSHASLGPFPSCFRCEDRSPTDNSPALFSKNPLIFVQVRFLPFLFPGGYFKTYVRCLSVDFVQVSFRRVWLVRQPGFESGSP